jgi:hypothetical protein
MEKGPDTVVRSPEESEFTREGMGLDLDSMEVVAVNTATSDFKKTIDSLSPEKQVAAYKMAMEEFQKAIKNIKSPDSNYL